jgi:hypothetical protein
VGIPIGYPINPNSGFGGATGISLEQTVSGLIAGNSYVLEFWAGGEFGTLIKKGLFAVDVGYGNIFLSNNPTQPFTGIGTRYIIEFNATSTSHLIKFTNWGHICDICTELILDDVRLYTLAELSPAVPHCTSGINDDLASESAVSVVLNSVTKELIVKTTNIELSEIIVYEIGSKKILQQKFTSSTSINTEQLAKGIYLYQVRNKNGVVKKGKLVKE